MSRRDIYEVRTQIGWMTLSFAFAYYYYLRNFANFKAKTEKQKEWKETWLMTKIHQIPKQDIVEAESLMTLTGNEPPDISRLASWSDTGRTRHSPSCRECGRRRALLPHSRPRIISRALAENVEVTFNNFASLKIIYRVIAHPFDSFIMVLPFYNRSNRFEKLKKKLFSIEVMS